MSMFKWEVVDPAPGRGGAADAAPAVGQDDRPRCPARGRHVRRHLRLPPGDGARRQPRHHVLGLLHDPVPADRAEPGAQLPRHERVVRGLGRGDPRARRGQRLVVRHRRDPRRRPRPRRRRCARALRRRPADPPDPAAGRHRRGRHADRLQPRSRRRRHLLAPGPVDRPADGGLHGLRGRGAPRLLVAHRGLPRPDLRLRAVLARRPRPRPHHLRASAAPPRRPSTTASPGPASRPPTGSACRAAPSPTASRSSTARRSRSPRSCSSCPASSRSSRRTPATSRPSPR